MFQPKQDRQKIKEEIRNEIREQVGEAKTSGTPVPGERQQIKEQILERLRKSFPFLLPAGVNQAEITSISGITLPTEIEIIKDSKTVTLRISEKTVILRKFGGKSNLSELHVGDIVSARGVWEDSERTILDTRVLRDISIQKRHGTFWGKIKSLDSAAQTFILKTGKRGEQKVFVEPETKIVSRNQLPLNFSDLVAGHRVRVTGLWDSNLRQIDETKVIKDWSIGPSATPTP